MRPFDPFFQRNSKIDRRTNRRTFLQFYISEIFLGLPDDIHEEKRVTNRRTDGRTDRRTDPHIEMRGRI